MHGIPVQQSLTAIGSLVGLDSVIEDSYNARLTMWKLRISIVARELSSNYYQMSFTFFLGSSAQLYDWILNA